MSLTFSHRPLCDKHGKEMADGAITTQWEIDGKVDVNDRRAFLCRVEGCNRHYEPTLWGYHDWSERKPVNESKHPCGRNHLCLYTYRYIAMDAGQIVLICPRCEEKKTENFAFENGEVEEPQTLGKEESKRLRELETFETFAACSGLNIKSPKNENPKNKKGEQIPDISCTINGHRYYFELAQIISQDFGHRYGKLISGELQHGTTFDQIEPFKRMVTEKALKRYSDDAHPRDLVLYFDIQLAPSDSSRLAALITPKLLENFNRVWVFDHRPQKLLFVRP